MSMYFHLMKQLKHFSRGVFYWACLTCVLLIAGCAVQDKTETAETQVGIFKAKLVAEGPACQQYRRLYVSGFRANVEAISFSDETLKKEAEALLAASEDALKSGGVSKDQCSRPYCIIEPLQEGKLDSWCGYRLPAERGPELYQWLNWADAE